MMTMLFFEEKKLSILPVNLSPLQRRF